MHFKELLCVLIVRRARVRPPNKRWAALCLFLFRWGDEGDANMQATAAPLQLVLFIEQIFYGA